MQTINLHEETGSSIYDWFPELASLIAVPLQEQQPALHGGPVVKGHAELRDAVQSLLANLSRAMQLERPELFAYYVADCDELSAIATICAVDDATVLGQIRDTIQQSMRGPRGELACEYILFALDRLRMPEEIAA